MQPPKEDAVVGCHLHVRLRLMLGADCPSNEGPSEEGPSAEGPSEEGPSEESTCQESTRQEGGHCGKLPPPCSAKMVVQPTKGKKAPAKKAPAKKAPAKKENVVVSPLVYF